MKARAAFRHWAEDTTRGGQSPNPGQHLPGRVRGVQPGTCTAGGAVDLQGRQRGQEAVPTCGQPGPERTTENTAQPVPLSVSEPAAASARRHVRKPETHEHGHLPEVPATLRPCGLTLSGFSLLADSSWKKITWSTAHTFLKLFPSQISKHQHSANHMPAWFTPYSQVFWFRVKGVGVN